MSSTLTWEPAHRKTTGLPDQLKYALQKRYDGTVDTTMNEGDIPYLEGLRDAGVKGADELIEAIRKYGDVAVREEF